MSENDNLDFNRIEKRARKNAEVNAGRRIPRDVQPEPTKDRRDDASAILRNDETQQAKDTANIEKNTGNTRTVSALPAIELSDSDRELLNQPINPQIMRDKDLFRRWSTLQIGEHPDTGEKFDVNAYKGNPTSSQTSGNQQSSPQSIPATQPNSSVLQPDSTTRQDPKSPAPVSPPSQQTPSNLSQQGTGQQAPQPSTKQADSQGAPSEQSDQPTLPGSRLSESDRELLNSTINPQIMGDAETFRRWSSLSQGEHPDTGEKFDREQEEKTYKREKERSDTAAIVSQAGEVPNTELSEPEPQRRSTAIDMAQLGLDAIGVIDPTGIADGANAVISLTRAVFDKERRAEHLKNAAISAVSIIPYAGDLAKTLKLPGAAKTVRNAAKLSDVAKAQKRAQYRQTTSSVIEAFSEAGDQQQSQEADASGGGAGQPPIPPRITSGVPPSGDNPGENPREAEDRIRGQQELDEQTQNLTKTFEDLTFGVGATILAFASLFESSRALNRANLERKTYLAEVNGDIARALAIREIATVQRNLREGETMEDALGRASRADTRMEDARERVTSPLSSIYTDVTASFSNVVVTVAEAVDSLSGFSRGLKLASEVVGFFADKIEQGTRTARILIDLFSPFGSMGSGSQKGTATTRFLDDISDGKLDGKSKSGNFFS